MPQLDRDDLHERDVCMSPRKHATLLVQAIRVWLAFWLIGRPDDYQQYSMLTMAVASVLLSVATSLAAIVVLQIGRNETRVQRAFWLSFYYT